MIMEGRKTRAEISPNMINLAVTGLVSGRSSLSMNSGVAGGHKTPKDSVAS